MADQFDEQANIELHLRRHGDALAMEAILCFLIHELENSGIIQPGASPTLKFIERDESVSEFADRIHRFATRGSVDFEISTLITSASQQTLERVNHIVSLLRDNPSQSNSGDDDSATH